MRTSGRNTTELISTLSMEPMSTGTPRLAMKHIHCLRTGTGSPTRSSPNVPYQERHSTLLVMKLVVERAANPNVPGVGVTIISLMIALPGNTWTEPYYMSRTARSTIPWEVWRKKLTLRLVPNSLAHIQHVDQVMLLTFTVVMSLKN